MKQKTLLLIAVIFLSSLAYSLSPPKIVSPSEDEWHYGRVFVKWEEASGATGYAYLFDKDPLTEVPSSVGCEDVILASYAPVDGIYYFHIASCNGSERSTTEHLKLNLDSTAPSAVENLTVEATNDGRIRISWDEATDSLSGLASYTLYRNGLFKFAIDDTSTKKYPGITGTEYIDGNVHERYHYNYKITAYDKADNRGPVTFTSKGATVLGSCDANVMLSVSKSASSLEISVSSDLALRGIVLSVKAPDAEPEEVFTGDNNKAINYSFSLSGKPEGQYIITLDSKDSEQDPCFFEKPYFLDSKKPSIRFTSPKSNENVFENSTISFDASDGQPSSGIKGAKLFIKKDAEFTEISPLSADLSTYSYSLNVSSYETGKYTLKAEVVDNAGNSSEETIGFSISNMESLKNAAEEKIGEAESLAKDLEAAISNAELLGVDSSAAKEKMLSASGAMGSAKQLLEGKNYSEASAEAESSKSLLNEAKSLLSITLYNEDSFSFSRPKLKDLLAEAGFSEEAVDEADSFFSTYEPKRKLKIFSVKEGESEYYAVVAEIEANSADENAPYLYERVPKELTAYLGEVSLPQVQIVSKDPLVISAQMQAKDSKFVFSYLFDKKLSKEEADALVSDKEIQKYSLPPIVYGSSSLYLKNLGSGIGLEALFVAGIIIVILLAAVFTGIFLYKNYFPKGKKKGNARLGL